MHLYFFICNTILLHKYESCYTTSDMADVKCSCIPPMCTIHVNIHMFIYTCTVLPIVRSMPRQYQTNIAHMFLNILQNYKNILSKLLYEMEKCNYMLHFSLIFLYK